MTPEPTNPPRPHLAKIMRCVATLIRVADFDEDGDARKTIALDAKHAADALQAENEKLRASLTEAWQLGRVRGDQALVAICARGLEVAK